MWQGFDAALVISAGLEQRQRELALEQSVRGLDAMRELELHALVASACEVAGFGVLREVVYPTLGEATRNSARWRCDVVLTPLPGQTLLDELATRREAAAREGTLFAGAREAENDGPRVNAGACLWVEIKTVAQFAYTNGVPVPNRGYGSELVQSLRTDLDKLAADPAIVEGVVVLVLFTQDERTARNDLIVAANRCLDHASAIASMSSRSFAITDRAGNACCTVAAFDVLK
ncbi:MAG TPA: hypothetical protein VF777_08560 [Phycisphaerales bacterium]